MLGLSFDHGHELAQRNVRAGGLLAQQADTPSARSTSLWSMCRR